MVSINMVLVLLFVKIMFVLILFATIKLKKKSSSRKHSVIIATMHNAEANTKGLTFCWFLVLNFGCNLDMPRPT